MRGDVLLPVRGANGEVARRDQRRDGGGDTGGHDESLAAAAGVAPSTTPSLRDGEAIVMAARAWLGTPYRHQVSVKGAGADCLGLVRGVWREVVGQEPAIVPAYTPDWAELGGKETLLEAARRWLVPVEGAWRPGDVLVFRMSLGVPAKHCAILSAVEGPEPRMIHAYWGRAVVESWMGPWWRSKVAGAFRFPVGDDAWRR